MILSREEMVELQKAIELRKREIEGFLNKEPGGKEQDSDWKRRLGALSRIKNKLERDRDELIDYSGYHILIVDDAPLVREYISLFLRENGFTYIDEADDGHSAIVKIKNKKSRYGKQSPYDLVLCDVNMPTISGLDVLKLIRQSDNSSTTPFIMITGVMDKERLLEAVELGIDAYVTKPFEEQDLLAKINTALQ